MVRFDLSDCNDAYIVVTREIDLLADATHENDKAQKNITFKNYAPFRSCISKINNTLIEVQKIWIQSCRCIICYNTATIAL